MASFKEVEYRLASIETVLARQDQKLTDHLRRTSHIEEAIEPMKTHIRRVEGGAKVIGLIFTALVSFLGLFKLFS